MRRLETGSLVAALGAALLLVSLFLSWYQPALTAWDAFEVWDLVLAALALAVLAVAAAELGWWRGPVPPVEVLVLGGAALVVVAAALLNHPPAASGRDLEGGAWLGLVGAALSVAGGLMARAGVSLSLTLEPQGARPRPVAPPPSGPPGSASKVGPTFGSPPPAPPPRPAHGSPPPAPPPRPAGGTPPPAPSPRPAHGSPPPAPSPRPAAAPPGRGLFARRRSPQTPEEETETTRRLPRDSDLGPPPQR